MPKVINDDRSGGKPTKSPANTPKDKGSSHSPGRRTVIKDDVGGKTGGLGVTDTRPAPAIPAGAPPDKGGKAK